jgi:hypothetical protein
MSSPVVPHLFEKEMQLINSATMLLLRLATLRLSVLLT